MAYKPVDFDPRIQDSAELPPDFDPRIDDAKEETSIGGEFVKGAKAGWLGANKAVGSVVEYAGELTGSDTVRDIGKTSSDYWGNLGKPEEGAVQNMTGIGGVEDFAKWAAWNVGQMGSQVAVTAPFMAAGSLGKAVPTGIEAIKALVTRAPGAAGKFGQFLGQWAKLKPMDIPIGTLEAGQIAEGQLDDLKSGKTKELSPVRGLAAAFVATKLEELGAEGALNRLMHGAGGQKGKILRRIGKGALNTGIGEGTEEFFQSYAEKVGIDPTDTLSYKQFVNAVNGAGAGFIGGFALGGGGGAISRQRDEQATPTPDTQAGTPGPPPAGAPPSGPTPGAPAPLTGKLSPEFFRDVKKAIKSGVDNDGQPFSQEDARGILEAYKAQKDADPVSVAVFEKIIGPAEERSVSGGTGEPITRPAPAQVETETDVPESVGLPPPSPPAAPAATATPTPGAPAAPTPEQSLSGFRTFLESGPDMESISIMKGDVLTAHPQLADDLNKAIIEHEGSKLEKGGISNGQVQAETEVEGKSPTSPLDISNKAVGEIETGSNINDVADAKSPTVPLEKSNAPAPGTKAFIENKIRQLGSIEAVNAFYTGKDTVSDYARTVAPKILGEGKKGKTLYELGYKEGEIRSADAVLKIVQDQIPAEEFRKRLEAVKAKEKQPPAKTPYEYGKAAFVKGLPATTMADKDFIEGYSRRNGASVEDLSEWNRGWHEANAAAPVPGMPDLPSSKKPAVAKEKSPYGRAGASAFKKIADAANLKPDMGGDYRDLVSFFEKYYNAGAAGNSMPRADIHPQDAQAAWQAGRKDREAKAGKNILSTGPPPGGWKESDKVPQKYRKPTGTPIGKNSQGEDIYEDDKGVRKVIKADGRAEQEPVAMIPTRAGVMTQPSMPRDQRYEVAAPKPAEETIIQEAKDAGHTDEEIKSALDEGKEIGRAEGAHATTEQIQEKVEAVAKELGVGFAPEIKVQGEWSRNGLVFATEKEAADWGVDRMQRWMMAEDSRAVPVAKAPSHTWIGGELGEIGADKTEEPVPGEAASQEKFNAGDTVYFKDTVLRPREMAFTVESVSPIGNVRLSGEGKYYPPSVFTKKSLNDLEREVAAEKAPEPFFQETGVDVKGGKLVPHEYKPKAEAPAYGSANKLFTEDKANKARELLRKKLGGIHMGVPLDPEIIQAGIDLAGYHIEAGARTFDAYARKMISDLGDVIRPYLKSFYMAVRNYPGFDKEGMNNEAEVDQVDETTIDIAEKETKIESTGGTENEHPRDGSTGKRALAENQPAGLPSDGEGQRPGIGERGGGETDTTGDERLDVAEEDGAGGLAGEPAPIHLPDEGEVSGELQPEVEDQPTPASEPRSLKLSGDNPGNYRIAPEDHIGSGTRGQKIDRNLAAIRLVKKLEAEGRYPTPKEQSVLAKYVGWGGLKNVFKKESPLPQDIRAREELETLLTKEEYLSMFLSITDAHYTSPEIIGSMYDILRHMGFEGGNVLEPTYGAGNFLGLMPEDMAASSKWYGSELDTITAKIGQMLYPESQLIESGFQVAEFPFGKFDLAVGNPPFGDTRIADTKKNRSAINRFKIHNYVVAKEALHLKPGGILANVMTTRFLDTANPEARDFLSKNFKFLGAIRLPNDAFAKNAGTTVTTDIIFLQRLMPDEKPDLDADWLTTGATMTNSSGETITLNKYFVRNPQMMLGEPSMKGTMYGGAWKEGGKGEFTLDKREGQDVGALIRDLIKTGLPEMKGIVKERAGDKADAAALSLNINKEDVGIGGFYADGKKIYMRGDDDSYGNPTYEVLSPDTKWTEKTTLGQKKYDRIKGMLDLRAKAYKLIEAERFDQDGIEVLRKELNKAYDAYVKENGYLSEPANFGLMSDDIKIEFGLESGYKKEITATRAKALGIKPSPAVAVKASILNKRVFYPSKEIIFAKDVTDGYGISLSQKGKMDVGYIASLTGKTVDEVTAELSEKNLAYQDPETEEWIQEDLYLSGNVKAKYKKAMENGKEKNAADLKKVFPPDKGPENIYAGIGATWIPKDVYTAFGEFIGVVSPRIMISHDTGKVFMTGSASQNDVNVTWQNEDYGIAEVFNAAAGHKTLIAYDGYGDDRTVNRERTKALATIVKGMKSTFDDWLMADDARSRVIVKEYNDTQNTHAKRKYDEKHLRTVGASPAVELRNTQGNAAWRMIQSPIVMLDHAVGSGKTFTIITGIMERVRMGLTRKAIIAVPNHLVGQWSADWLKLYPGARILAATNKDFTKANRRRLFSRITTGSYDAIIVGHSSFGFIPIERESIRNLIMEEIAHLERAHADAVHAGEKRMANGLAKRIQKKRERIVELMNKPRDNVSHFEQMGIDHIVVDESHEFKNLEYSSAMQNVTGMGNPAGSKRAFDLYSKIRLLAAQKNTGITFATGTPISNSLVEMYAILRYLNRQGLVDRKLEAFDAWASAYATTENRIEYTASQKLKDRVIMSTFRNVRELVQLFEEFADSVTMDDLKRSYAEQIRESNRITGRKDREEFPIPKVEKGGRQLDLGDPDEAQKKYVDYLVARANRLQDLGRANDPKVDNHLWLMSDARKMALDIRLVDPTAKAGKNNKINRAAKNIKRIYDKWNADRGTQLVFCDLSTPAKTAQADAKAFIRAAAKIAKVDADDSRLKEQGSFHEQWGYLRHLIDAEIDAISESREAETAAYMHRREALETFLNEKATDAELASLTTADSGFSVYDELKATLIKRGIPAGEIRFIHEANTAAQKDELFGLVNSGAVRVLIGSTPKMGAGTNAQERMVALHHMDAPWRPSDVEQREGRLIRQGNALYDRDPEGFLVSVHAYSTSNTFDAVMWQILARKQAMLDDFRNGKDTINDTSNDSADFSEFMAATTGNPAFREKYKLEGEIEELTATMRRVATRRQSAEHGLKYNEQKRTEYKKDIEAYEGIAAKLKGISNNFTYEGKEYVNDLQESEDKERARLKVINDAAEAEHKPKKEKVATATVEKFPAVFDEEGRRKRDVPKADLDEALEFYRDELKKAGIEEYAKEVHYDRDALAKKHPNSALSAAIRIRKEVKDLPLSGGDVVFSYGPVQVKITASPHEGKNENEHSDYDIFVDDVFVDGTRDKPTLPWSDLETFLFPEKIRQEVARKIDQRTRDIGSMEYDDKKSQQTLEKLQFKEGMELDAKRRRYAEVVQEVNALEAQMEMERAGEENKYITADRERFSDWSPAIQKEKERAAAAPFDYPLPPYQPTKQQLAVLDDQANPDLDKYIITPDDSVAEALAKGLIRNEYAVKMAVAVKAQAILSQYGKFDLAEAEKNIQTARDEWDLGEEQTAAEAAADREKYEVRPYPPEIIEAERAIRSVKAGQGKLFPTVQYSPTSTTPGWSLSDVQSIFKGQEVIQPNPNGPIYIKTRGGQFLTIESVTNISPDEVNFKYAYGRKIDRATETITGSYGDGVVRLVRGKAGKWTLVHESGHFLEDTGILSSADIAILRGHIKGLVREGKMSPANKNDIGGSEDRANFIADALTKPQRGMVARVIERIKDFISRMGELVGLMERTAGSVVGDIESGRIFDRQATEAADNIERYSAEKTGPKKSIIAYKLFRTLKGRPGEIFPLFIGKSIPTPIGEWVSAEFIPTPGFSYRPGWHVGRTPQADHLMKKDGTLPSDRVWAEVEIPADKDWQKEADKQPTKDIQGHVPEGGYYRFKRPSNQGGEWLIAGSMKVNRILSEREVESVRQNGTGQQYTARPKSWAEVAKNAGKMSLEELQAILLDSDANGLYDLPVKLEWSSPETMNGEQMIVSPQAPDYRLTDNGAGWDVHYRGEYRNDFATLSEAQAFVEKEVNEELNEGMGPLTKAEAVRTIQSKEFRDNFNAIDWRNRGPKGKVEYSVEKILSNPEGYKKAKDSEPPKDGNPEAIKKWISDQADLVLQEAVFQLSPDVHKMGFLKKFLTSPEWYEHPVFSRIVRLFVRDRNEIFTELYGTLNNLEQPMMEENTVGELARKLKHKGLNWKQKMTGQSSKEYQDVLKIIDEADIDNVEYSEENLKKQGYSDDTITVWKAFRESYDKALDLMTAQMRTMIEQIEAEAAFTNTNPADFSDMYLTLKGALAQMGQLRGTYAPRTRQGNWAVRAERENDLGEKEYYREHRFSHMAAERLSRKLEAEGWNITEIGEIDKLPEDVYQDLKTVSVARAIEAAIDKMTKGQKGDAAQSQAVRFNEEILKQVADMIRARGFRSSMISRKPGTNVVKGYIEDPIERHALYINNVARGIAKAKVAGKAMEELAGKMIKGRRFGGIDPKTEASVYSTAKDYIEEQLRNLDKTDRVIGWAKSLATLKFMGFSARAAVVNMTAIATTAPAAIQQYVTEGRASFMKVNRALGVAGRDAAKFMAGKTVGTSDDMRFLQDEKRLGWDDPQYTRDMTAKIGSMENRAWAQTLDAAMWMFGKTEQWNRLTTMLAAYRLARGEGKNHEEAADLAKTASDKAHGIYGRATLPPIAWGRGPGAKIAQMLYVFSKFSHNYLQMLYDLGFRKHNWKAFSYALLAPVILSGVSAWPLKDQTIMPLLGILLSILGIKDKNEDMEKWLWDQTRKYLGEGAEIAGRYGTLGALGMDISGSLSIGVGIPRDVWEWGGAIGGVAKEGVTAFNELRKENYSQAAEHVLPAGLANIPKAYREATEGPTTLRGNRVWGEKGKPYQQTAGETGLRLAGFRSSRQATATTRLYEAKTQAAEFNEKRSSIYEAYRAYLAKPSGNSEMHKRIRERVREFNQSIRSANMTGEVAPITFESMRRQQEKMKQASKKERAMMR